MRLDWSFHSMVLEIFCRRLIAIAPQNPQSGHLVKNGYPGPDNIHQDTQLRGGGRFCETVQKHCIELADCRLGSEGHPHGSDVKTPQKCTLLFAGSWGLNCEFFPANITHRSLENVWWFLKSWSVECEITE